MLDMLVYYRFHTLFTLKAKAMSSSRDRLPMGDGVHLFTRSTESALARLLHSQRPFRKQLQGDICFINKTAKPRRQNKCLRFNPSLQCIQNLFPIPSVLFPHMHVRYEHKLTLVLEEQRNT